MPPAPAGRSGGGAGAFFIEGAAGRGLLSHSGKPALNGGGVGDFFLGGGGDLFLAGGGDFFLAGGGDFLAPAVSWASASAAARCTTPLAGGTLVGP